MRQNWSCLLEKEERSKMRQNCIKNARNTFGGEHLLDDTEICCLIAGTSLGVWEYFATFSPWFLEKYLGMLVGFRVRSH